MDYALKERIGRPELFTGRKEELAYFLKWINDIKDEKSQSTAVMARRKMGKTAIMERLFNITFFKNNGVIPFYYEIKENDVWVVDFCIDFCLTFVYQYIAFKSRKPEYLGQFMKGNFGMAKQTAVKEGLDYLLELIEGVEYAVGHNQVDILWEIVREAPKTMAFRQREFIVQMIDEFQFMNAKIYRDKALKNLAKTLAGGYLSTAESKIAPLLVSGSWVGWLLNELGTMLPNRFWYEFLGNMPENEAVEMIYKFSNFFDVPVTEQTAYLMFKQTEGSPFYISSLIRSRFPGKDLTTVKGLIDALEFETLDRRGNIKLTWMEYVLSTFKNKKVNGKNAKKIVLYLCQNRDRDVTRAELLEKLNLGLDDSELEEKLDAMVKGDIISQGQTHFDYRGIQDNIFDKVFRGVYRKEIQNFDVRMIREEYSEELEKLQEQYNRLLGKFNY
ncbi:MAG: hypothetical protein PVH61_23250 [Candidatus Aminicenantes bacterium]|jgi:hypothetical protein